MNRLLRVRCCRLRRRSCSAIIRRLSPNQPRFRWTNWAKKLTTLLKDQIHFQLNKQQQISTIRLDPPSLGKLEIAVQLDNGKLMVHIGANQSEVCRALQQFSDDLRQHLTAQNFMEVNVQVSSEGQSQQQQQSGHQQEEVSAALQLDDAPQFQQNESVLIKV